MKYQCPKGTTKKTQKYMKMVVSTLEESKSLCDVDACALDTLAINLDLVAQAKESIELGGIVITNAQGNLVAHPSVKIMKDAQGVSLLVMKEFGLTLKSRTNLNVREDTEESVVDKYD